ncbi:hypothetical protein EGW08_005658 [Elysia chlorotica]|uniref:Phospholipase B-like n=1 Tax=Elysia chlorotica TaxID=188477 RepID=A0A433TYD7_ELYCH|nr:hypothetical protein EGW08_005658 [Elysia chlorotica]
MAAARQAFRIFLALSVLPIIAAKVSQLWVIFDNEKEIFQISEQQPADYVAVASLANTINETGWAKLDVTTHAGPNRKYNDSVQAYAAGFVEGHLTRSLMTMHWTNTGAWVCPEPMTAQCIQLKQFLQKNMDWMLDNINTFSFSSPFWHHVRLFLEQSAGLQDGYAKMPGKLNLNIDIMGVYSWQVGGDFETLLNLFPTSSSSSSDQKVKTPDPMAMGTGHCSALLRLLPDYSDLYVAQDTWSDFSSMLRMLKRYSFEMIKFPEDPSTPAPGNTMTFSSYPGALYSGDDFYTISSGLLTQETTISYSNSALSKYIQPTSVLEGIRTMVANRLAASGREWAQIFSLSNSGTYNNEWMVVDYKLFEPGSKEPIKGLFTLLEQIPGTIVFEDMTEYLYKNMYFGSYNTPYFPEIFNKSGQPALVAKFGDWFTYERTPRALIFKRDAPKVNDLTAMIKLMRYNNFKHDPLSQCNCTPPYSGENAIAARCDLNPASGTYPFSALGHRPHAATDMKVTTFDLFKSLSFQAQSGPTFDDLPAFQWSTSSYKDNSHVGHPDVWKFPVITFNGANPMQ